jgi:hypothetical protein
MEAKSLGVKAAPWTPIEGEELARAITLHERGIAPAYIAARLGAGSGRVQRGAQEVRDALAAAGIELPTPGRKSSGTALAPERVAEILRLHDGTELTCAAISERVGSTAQTTKKHLLANGRVPRNGKAGRPPHESRRAEDGRPWGKTQWQYDLDMAIVATSKCARCPWEYTGTAGELAGKFREHECAAGAEAA